MRIRIVQTTPSQPLNPHDSVELLKIQMPRVMELTQAAKQGDRTVIGPMVSLSALASRAGSAGSVALETLLEGFVHVAKTDPKALITQIDRSADGERSYIFGDILPKLNFRLKNQPEAWAAWDAEMAKNQSRSIAR